MGINHVASLCGYIFEDYYALELLQSGGSFTCRELFDGRKKHPSMGSTGIGAFQMTVSRDHVIRGDTEPGFYPHRILISLQERNLTP